MEEQKVVIDLREIMPYLWSNIIIIILSTLIGGLGMYFLSSTFMERQFQSSTKIYVLNQQDSQTVTYTDLQTGLQLTKDYAELIVSRTVTTRVIAELDLQNTYEDMKNITAEQLASMIQVATQSDTRILKITVTDTNPTRAQDIANAVRVAASEQIYQVMDTEAVNVVDYANLPEGPVSPNLTKNAVIGAMLGFILVVGILIVGFVLDDTIKTPDDVERYLGLSVLAMIPYDKNSDTGKRKKRKKRATSASVARARVDKNIPTIGA